MALGLCARVGMSKHLVYLAIIISLALGTAATRAQTQTPPPAPAPPQTTAAPQAPGYAWADACKKCHEPIYEAWARTKHATALDRLSSSEQEKDCINCHVTGPKAKITEGRKVVNAGVQCETCHGPAAAHVADPTVKAGLVKSPKQDMCEECHSSKSPHFKGFFFAAMAPIVHHVR
jgi:Cytochrome c554 and c-prime